MSRSSKSSASLGTWISRQIYNVNLYALEEGTPCRAYGKTTNSKQLSVGLTVHSFLISFGSKSLINSCYETLSKSGVKPWMFLCHFQTKDSGFSVTPLRFSRTSNNNASLTSSVCYVTKGRSGTIALLSLTKALLWWEQSMGIFLKRHLDDQLGS